jgi:topoisomerase-4 subunit A
VHETEEESAANTVVVHLKPALRLRNVSRLFSFGEIAVKGRASRGNIVTKLMIDRVVRATASDLGES